MLHPYPIFRLDASLTATSQTIRIQATFDCSLCATGSSNCLITHIHSEAVESGVLAAVPLWNGQFDLAVEPASIDKVNVHFTNFTRYRLETTDPLFLPQSGCSQAQAALGALERIHNKYQQWHCTKVTDKSNDRTRVEDTRIEDTRIEDWFAMEIKNLEKRIKDIEKRIKDIDGSVGVCDR